MGRQWKADDGRRKEEEEGEEDRVSEEEAGREGKWQNRRERCIVREDRRKGEIRVSLRGKTKAEGRGRRRSGRISYKSEDKEGATKGMGRRRRYSGVEAMRG